MLDANRLSLLRDLALHGSLAATAKSLGVSPSAVSQQLARLEKDTGVKLLVPRGRGVRLTPVAARLVEHTERILEEVESAETMIEESRGVLSGTLQIATYGTYASSSLPAITHDLARQHPDLQLSFTQLDPESAFEALSARRVDLIVVDEYPGFPLPPQRGFARETVTIEELGLYLPHDPELSGNEAVDVSRLPWVFEPKGTEANRWARNVCRIDGFEPRVLYHSPDLHVHLRLVETGLAASFLPHALAERSAVSLRRASELITSELRRTVSVIVRRGSERRPDILACREAIHTQGKTTV